MTTLVRVEVASAHQPAPWSRMSTVSQPGRIIASLLPGSFAPAFPCNSL